MDNVDKGYVVRTLEAFIKSEHLVSSPNFFFHARNANVIRAMELLASIQGWNIQRCMRQGSDRLKRRTDNG